MWASSKLFLDLLLFSCRAPAIPPWLVDEIRLFFPGGDVLVFLLFVHLFYSLRCGLLLPAPLSLLVCLLQPFCTRAFLHLHWNSRFSLSTFQAWAHDYHRHREGVWNVDEPHQVTKEQSEVRIILTTHGAKCQTVGHNKWWMQQGGAAQQRT